MPEISVVMTSYNHARYLPEAIESVLGQTFNDFELIIVDDASTDTSRNIIRRYAEKDKRVYFVFHEKNAGISKTTNDGFSAAKGKYIAYIQSDDLWMSDKLEKQIKILTENKDVVVWSDAMIIDDNSNPTGLLFTEKCKATNKAKSGNLFSELVKGNYICGQSVIFRTDATQKIQFDPGLVYANDYKFMLQLSREYEFRFIEEPLVQYRIHADNSIHKNREIWKKDSFKICRYLLREYGRDIPAMIKAKLYHRIGRYLYERKRFAYAAKFIGRAITMNRRKTSYYKHFLKSYFKSVLK